MAGHDNFNQPMDSVKPVDHGMENISQQLSTPGDLNGNAMKANTADNTAKMVSGGSLPDLQLSDSGASHGAKHHDTSSDNGQKVVTADQIIAALTGGKSQAQDNTAQYSTRDQPLPSPRDSAAHYGSRDQGLPAPRDTSAPRQYDNQGMPLAHTEQQAAHVVQNQRPDFTVDSTTGQAVVNTRHDFNPDGVPADKQTAQGGQHQRPDFTVDSTTGLAVENKRHDFNADGVPAEKQAAKPTDSGKTHINDFHYEGEPTDKQFTQAKGTEIGNELKSGASDQQIAADLQRALQNGSKLEDIVAAANKVTAKDGLGAPHLQLRTGENGQPELTLKHGPFGGTQLKVTANNEVSVGFALR